MEYLFFKHLGKVMIAFITIAIVVWIIAIVSLSNQIEKNGGLGKSIGKFINDIQTEIEK